MKHANSTPGSYAVTTCAAIEKSESPLQPTPEFVSYNEKMHIDEYCF